MRKNDLNFPLGTFRRVAPVASVVHVVVGIAEQAADRSPLQGPSLRDSGRAEEVAPEVDPVLPGEAECDDVTADVII